MTNGLISINYDDFTARHHLMVRIGTSSPCRWFIPVGELLQSIHMYVPSFSGSKTISLSWFVANMLPLLISYIHHQIITDWRSHISTAWLKDNIIFVACIDLLPSAPVVDKLDFSRYLGDPETNVGCKCKWWVVLWFAYQVYWCVTWYHIYIHICNVLVQTKYCKVFFIPRPQALEL